MFWVSLQVCINFKFSFLVLSLLSLVRFTVQTPKASTSWELLIATDGIKFSPRNAHASCVFKGKIWVTGGKTARYTDYNLLDSYKIADVWYSVTGGLWQQVEAITGDYFAQNTEVTQPGPIAPWYARYGHTLTALDLDGNGQDDLMIMMGGYASSPSNDVWVSETGTDWLYTGLAPWSPRAWHAAAVFKGQLYMMGGTPLNNEVWRLGMNNISVVNNRPAPLTRSLYSNKTYALEWMQLPDAPWSPRVGMSLLSHWYFNTSRGETVADSAERLVLAGGYGGFLRNLTDSSKFDGFYCRADTWSTHDGVEWQLLNPNNAFGGRAWFGLSVRRAKDPRLDVNTSATAKLLLEGVAAEPPKMYLFGGGYIGFQTVTKQRVTKMIGKADAYWSIDGATWTRINHQEGGGSSTAPFFSSQEWAQTVVDQRTQYLGMWGMTVVSFNAATRTEFPGNFHFIGGDYTERGDYSSNVYVSRSGILCDTEGVVCRGQGECESDGCKCAAGTYGERCELGSAILEGSAGFTLRPVVVLTAAAAVTVATLLLLSV